jgi:tetratricopeptide (TPR) repeat protein
MLNKAKMNIRFLFTKEFIFTIYLAVSISYSSTVLALDFNYYIEQGDKYYSKFNNLDAIREYEKAYRLSPNGFDVLSKLANAYNDYGEDLKDSNSDGAETYFEDAIKYAEILKSKYPTRAESYFLVASAYGNLALYKGGKDKVRLARNLEKYAKKAIELDPNFAPAYVVLGIYYRETATLNVIQRTFATAFLGGLPEGSLNDSVRELLKAEKLSPESIFTHFELAETYEKLNEEDKAISEYRRVLDLPLSDHQDKMKKQEAGRRIRKLENNKMAKSIQYHYLTD